MVGHFLSVEKWASYNNSVIKFLFPFFIKEYVDIVSLNIF